VAYLLKRQSACLVLHDRALYLSGVVELVVLVRVFVLVLEAGLIFIWIG